MLEMAITGNAWAICKLKTALWALLPPPSLAVTRKGKVIPPNAKGGVPLNRPALDNASQGVGWFGRLGAGVLGSASQIVLPDCITASAQPTAV